MKIEYVRHDGSRGLYTAILNQPGNHYGQIILGRVWNEYDGTGWRASRGGAGFRTRGQAARALLTWYADEVIQWNGRKAKR